MLKNCSESLKRIEELVKNVVAPPLCAHLGCSLKYGIVLLSDLLVGRSNTCHLIYIVMYTSVVPVNGHSTGNIDDHNIHKTQPCTLIQNN